MVFLSETERHSLYWQAFLSFLSPFCLAPFFRSLPFLALANHRKSRYSVFLYSENPQKRLLRRPNRGGHRTCWSPISRATITVGRTRKIVFWCCVSYDNDGPCHSKLQPVCTRFLMITVGHAMAQRCHSKLKLNIKFNFDIFFKLVFISKLYIFPLYFF